MAPLDTVIHMSSIITDFDQFLGHRLKDRSTKKTRMHHLGNEKHQLPLFKNENLPLSFGLSHSLTCSALSPIRTGLVLPGDL